MRCAILSLLIVLSIRPAGAQEAPFFGRLLDQAAYKLDVSATYFREGITGSGRPIDDSRGEIHERLSLESQAAISDRLTFKLSGFAVGSTQSEEYRGVVSPPGYDGTFGRYVDFSELAALFEADEYDVLIGKGPLAVGLSTLVSPANRYGVHEIVDPMHGIELGTWQVTGTYYIGDNSLAASWLPFETRSPTPPSTSRWLGDSGDPTFFSLSEFLILAGLPADTDLSVLIEEDYREPRPQNWAYLLHWSGVGEGYDYFLAGHYGPSVYPALRREGEARIIKVNPDALTLSGGFSATVEAWEFHGEAALQDTHDNQDQDFLKYVIGFIYRESTLAENLGLEEITPIVEWSDEVVFDGQSAAGYILDSRDARPLPKSVLARIEFRRDDELSYIAGGALNFQDHDYALNAGIEYKPNDNMTISVTARSFGGDPETQFGRWRKNDHIELRLSHLY